MENIKFSVLMSVYYKEKTKYLKEALDSIINQTLKPNEIVLVEDGILTDELEDLVIYYENKYSFIKVIRLTQNVGLGKALNEGLKYCNFEYVARMDSDDISDYKRFEKQVEFLRKNKQCDVVGGNIIEFDDVSGKDISFRTVPLACQKIKNYSQKRNPMNHVTVMFKKKSVENVGGYLDCPYFEDYYLWIRMICANNYLENIPEILVRVRAGLNMTNRRGNLNYIKSIIDFENRLLKRKYINIFTYIYNITIRSIVSLLPNKLRYYIYQKKLRDKYH